MNTEAMTAEQFAESFGNRIAATLGWVHLTAATVEDTGGGCTATVLTFTERDGRVCSLVAMATHSAIGGDVLDNLTSDDGEFLVVGVYNVAELFEQTYDGSDPRDIHCRGVESLANYCYDYLREWERVTR